ncbi:conjugal transfer protein TraM [Aliarcobacter butzleri]|uniref:Conjugal transfer protein TraM n=1 Tax=Aliarcobacter butzleri TaxID=28197 RepID=A0AAW7Q174_9BACT|nr:conjugal transfer protein TraM [Aliarcobacter butzleri]MDN5071429.1 conjugal transfer protein TraM [Aliarcobacter butzleri]
MDKKEILEEIAKRHHIILDSNDPIFAVVTANELIFNDFLSKADKLFIKHKMDLESYKVAILKELKDYSRDNHELLKTLLRNETDLSNQIKKEDNSSTSSSSLNIKKYIAWFILGQVVFLFLGLIIGLLI